MVKVGIVTESAGERAARRTHEDIRTADTVIRLRTELRRARKPDG
jgi:hypothetical protein